MFFNFHWFWGQIDFCVFCSNLPRKISQKKYIFASYQIRFCLVCVANANCADCSPIIVLFLVQMKATLEGWWALAALPALSSPAESPSSWTHCTTSRCHCTTLYLASSTCISTRTSSHSTSVPLTHSYCAWRCPVCLCHRHHHQQCWRTK